MKKSILAVLALIAVVALAYGLWLWGFCRFYVPPNHLAVITAKAGQPLADGQILAEPGQKGIQALVLGEGRHFRNPVMFDWEILPLTQIEVGQVGVVTSKVGANLPEGEFLAEPGQRGIWRGALGPGKYRLNPYGYKVDIVDVTGIPIGYAGVITSLSGTQAPAGTFAQPGQKGIREDILQPGLYYINPKEYKVDVLEIGLNQVSLLGRDGGEVITKQLIQAPAASANVVMENLAGRTLERQQVKRREYIAESSQLRARAAPAAMPTPRQQEARDLARMPASLRQQDSMASLGLAEFIEFPSRDGFQIHMDMTVEFELPPKDIAGIFRRFGDLPAVVDKIILPQITSVSRNKGSEYGAKDFIVGAGREKFQDDMTATLAETLGQRAIVVHNALIRHVEVPIEILDPIQQASIAIEQDLTNKELQNTARKQAELNTELSLIEQAKEQVAQETSKLKAEIKAEQERDVARLQAQALRQEADIARQTAAQRADIRRKLATAEAQALEMVEGERAQGWELKAATFKDPLAFALRQLALGLRDDLEVHIIHAGEGTLWTDLQNARLSDLGGAGALQRKAPAK
ncbi:MAG: hypothetical protein K9N49_06250 [Candidatus Marinimicrobia bacterium]|nr:hypothetical protein [Candidatus Neomarinimicrobiota bacterium]